jgi:hypothetical protein
MPAHARRNDAGLFDQFEDDHPIADWGGDELFTRMPRPRPVDDAPAPRFRPSLALVDTPQERRPVPSAEGSGAPGRRREQEPGAARRERAEWLGLSVVEEDRPAAVEDAVRRWDAILEPSGERAPNGRRTKVITGRPDGAPRPLSLVPSDRRRPSRTPAEWVGPRPDRIVAWAFVLGLLLIVVAISTADAATL